jgi:hypothetical protein
MTPTLRKSAGHEDSAKSAALEKRIAMALSSDSAASADLGHSALNLSYQQSVDQADRLGSSKADCLLNGAISRSWAI